MAQKPKTVPTMLFVAAHRVPHLIDEYMHPKLQDLIKFEHEEEGEDVVEVACYTLEYVKKYKSTVSFEEVKEAKRGKEDKQE